MTIEQRLSSKPNNGNCKQIYLVYTLCSADIICSQTNIIAKTPVEAASIFCRLHRLKAHQIQSINHTPLLSQ